MNTFGLDIGTTTIKICQTLRQGTKVKLLSAGLISCPEPGLVSEAETDLVAVATTIKKLHQDTRITTNKVVLGLPEDKIFSKIIEMPQMKESELTAAIPWEAEQIIPLPLSEVTLDWQIIGTIKGADGVEKIRVMIVVAPNSLIDKYSRVMKMADLEIVAIETELMAASRSLLPASSGPTIIVDMGASSTDLAISDKEQVVFSRSIPTAGEALTRVLSTSLTMNPAQAEQYKIAYGLDENQFEGKIKTVLTPVIDVIISEIKKTILFWNESEKEPISSIILYGGTANLPQLTTIMAKALGIEVQVADPLKSTEVEEKLRVELLDKTALLTVVVGLSEKEL